MVTRRAARSYHFAFVSTMDGMAWGGSEELWSQTALKLADQGHRVRASVLNWGQRPKRILELSAKGVDVAFRARHWAFRERFMRACWRRVHSGPLERKEAMWVARGAPDLVLVSQGGPWDGIAWMQSCRHQRLSYCAVVQANSEIWWPLDEQAAVIRPALQSARRVYFVSRANRDLMELQCGARFENFEVVANPFNLTSHRAIPWPKDDGVLRLACVARLEPRAKGQDLLLEVLSQPKWRQRRVEVGLFGTGPCEQLLRSLSSLLSLENVNFRGHVSDVAAIWAEHHALVLPSRFEGLPLVIAEAMLCGRPVITTDVAGNAELVSDGVNGFVAPAPALQLLDAALERAWAARDRWQEMGRQARADVMRLLPSDPVGRFTDLLLALVRPEGVSAPTSQVRTEAKDALAAP